MSKTYHKKPQLPRAPIARPGQFHGDGKRPKHEPTVEEGLAEYEQEQEDQQQEEDLYEDSLDNSFGYWDNACSCFRTWEELDYEYEP